MKVKTTITKTTTEIECSAEEIRQSNSVSDGIMNVFRRAFNGPIFSTSVEEEADEGENEETDSE